MADSTVPILRVLCMALLATVVTGCKAFRTSCHEPKPYQSATTGSTLKIPDGLEAPDTSQALKIPELNEPAPPPRREGDPCLDGPPPYAVPKPPPEPAA